MVYCLKLTEMIEVFFNSKHCYNASLTFATSKLCSSSQQEIAHSQRLDLCAALD